MIGKLLAAPIRLINAPLRVAENLIDCKDEDDRVLSKPLTELSNEVEKAVDGEKPND